MTCEPRYPRKPEGTVEGLFVRVHAQVSSFRGMDTKGLCSHASDDSQLQIARLAQEVAWCDSGPAKVLLGDQPCYRDIVAAAEALQKRLVIHDKKLLSLLDSDEPADAESPSSAMLSEVNDHVSNMLLEFQNKYVFIKRTVFVGYSAAALAGLVAGTLFFRSELIDEVKGIAQEQIIASGFDSAAQSMIENIKEADSMLNKKAPLGRLTRVEMAAGHLIDSAELIEEYARFHALETGKQYTQSLRERTPKINMALGQARENLPSIMSPDVNPQIVD